MVDEVKNTEDVLKLMKDKDVKYVDLRFTDPSGLGGAPDRLDRALDQVIADHDLDFYLRQEVDNVIRTAIQFSVSLLTAKTLGLGDGNTLESDFLKRLFNLVELEWLDDGFDFLH